MRNANRWTLLCVILALAVSAPAALPADHSDAPPMEFTDAGAQVGQQLPNLPLIELDGTASRMGDLWLQQGGDGTLLITSSYTCPKSRSKLRMVEMLAEAVSSHVSVQIIYVIEAHPVGDVSPYLGREEVTAENRREGILCRQPTTMQERLALAGKFKRLLHSDLPIHVDPMNDPAWRALGGGPNMGVLVDRSGVVIARQGWFDQATMRRAIDAFIAADRHERQRRKLEQETGREFEARLKGQGVYIWDLLRPFKGGDVEGARKTLRQYPELTTIGHWDGRSFEGGNVLLDVAKEDGTPAMATLLVQAGAKVNSANKLSVTPLMVAAASGNLGVARVLLDNGADVNQHPAHGPGALHEALIHGHHELADTLVKAGANADLFVWSAMGDLEKVKPLLIKDPSCGSRPDGWGRTPLAYAAATGQVEMAKLLFRYGVSDAPSSAWQQDWAVHWAARGRQWPMVELLLKAGTDPNAVGQYGDTLAHIAVELKSTELIDIAARYNTNLNLVDTRGLAALHLAVTENLPEIVERLIQRGAKIEVTSDVDRSPCGPFMGEPPRDTPLHLAAEAANARMAALLLERGASVNARDERGRTPLHMALTPRENQAESRKVVELLLRAGAEVNARDSDQKTPLDLAVSSGDEASTRMLRADGAQPGPKEPE